MKKISLLFFALVVSTGWGYSQCNNYYDFKEGSLFEVESYSSKDKKEGRVLSKVTGYSQSGDGFEAVILSTIFDKKDKEAHQGEYKMSCSNGVMLIDMKKFIPEESLKSMGGGELEVTGDFLEIPTHLSVGQTLKDGFVEVKMAAGQPMNMSITVTISDRKVVGKETITTPAGTFDCYKVTYNLNSKTTMMGMNMNNNMTAEEWVSQGVGTVKTSSYNSKGAMIGYTLLSRYEK